MAVVSFLQGVGKWPSLRQELSMFRTCGAIVGKAILINSLAIPSGPFAFLTGSWLMTGLISSRLRGTKSRRGSRLEGFQSTGISERLASMWATEVPLKSSWACSILSDVMDPSRRRSGAISPDDGGLMYFRALKTFVPELLARNFFQWFSLALKIYWRKYFCQSA